MPSRRSCRNTGLRAGAAAGWWVKTVRLDQEAKGNLVRRHRHRPG